MFNLKTTANITKESVEFITLKNMIVIQEHFIVKLSPCPAESIYKPAHKKCCLSCRQTTNTITKHGQTQKIPSGRGGVSLVINVIHRRLYEPPLRSNWTLFRGGSTPVFLRKPIATCDFPGEGVRTPCPPPPPPCLNKQMMFISTCLLKKTTCLKWPLKRRPKNRFSRRIIG